MSELKMILKLNLGQEQFASLATFLVSKENKILPPEGFGFTSSSLRNFCRMVKSEQTGVDLVPEQHVVLEILISAEVSSKSETKLSDFKVPNHYLIALTNTVGIFPASSKVAGAQ